MNIAILGTAHPNVDTYDRVLKDMPGVRLVGFADDSPHAETFARKSSIPRFRDADTLMRSGIDAVIIASHTARHSQDIVRAASYGMHIFCEKHLATTLDDAQHIKATCDRQGVLFMPALPLRFDPALRAARQRIHNHDLGRILGMNAVNHSHNPAELRAWFAQPHCSGGGALFDHLAHFADFARWCFDSDVNRVYV